MSDQIFIRDLRFDAIIGILPIEREQPQPVVIDLTIDVDTRKAAMSHDLNDSVDYGELAERVQQHTQHAQALLVETLVNDIADIALSYAGVEKVSVSVTKPNALTAAGGVGVTIQRSRQRS